MKQHNKELEMKQHNKELEMKQHNKEFEMKQQSGFTLVEIIVVLAIIGIFSAVLFKSFGGDSSKVTALSVKVNEVRDALLLYDTKTGCFPNNLQVLFNKGLATAANNYCGQDTTANYGTSDYIASLPAPAAAANGLDLSQTGLSGVYTTIAQSVGGFNNYVLQVQGLSPEAVTSFMSQCDTRDFSAGVPTAYTGDANLVTARCVTNGASEVDVLITKY